MWDLLQHSGWVTTLATSRGLYGLALVVHYSAVCFCVGTIVLLDLRILGVAARTHALSALAGQVQSAIWIGFGSAVVSGFLLFTTKAASYAAVTPFRVKMLIVGLAVVSALVVQWGVPKWDRAPVIPVTAKLVAVMSMVLWLGAILVSVEIPALTGIG
jgi:hypothetical protein